MIPERKMITDSIIFGIIASKDLQFDSWKKQIKKDFHTLWPRQESYITVSKDSLISSSASRKYSSVFRNIAIKKARGLEINPTTFYSYDYIKIRIGFSAYIDAR